VSDAEARSFAVVVAADEDNGIGLGGKLPWRLPAEMAFFKRLTSEAAVGRRNAVVMGRKTYESIPQKFRPLPDRFNFVLSRDPSYQPQGAFAVLSLDEALTELSKLQTVDRVFVIGGGEIYREALDDARCERVYLTRVHARFACDTVLPDLAARFRRVEQDGPHAEQDVRYTFELHERR
jgi:dihydrofolate reductase